ncbi:hypothetical protein CDL15_Pgr005970 [Punica granatum]|nr:hypothetical protein CDL15_Pgr005970 [Punica granatum]
MEYDELGFGGDDRDVYGDEDGSDESEDPSYEPLANEHVDEDDDEEFLAKAFDFADMIESATTETSR